MSIPTPFTENTTGLRLVRVSLHGKRGDLRHTRSHAHQLARDLMGTLTTLVLPPSRPPHPGFGVIAHVAGEVETDGAAIPVSGRSCVIAHGRDCPYVIAENRRLGLAALAHAGRWSLEHNVVEALIHAITRSGDASQVHCFITGGIRHGHFHHDVRPDLVANLITRHRDGPEPVITDPDQLSLDLFAAIRNDLIRCGVPTTHVRDDGLCTHCHPDLSSKRAADAGIEANDRMNWVVAQCRR